VIGLSESENKPRRDLTFCFLILFCIVIIFAYILWYFVLPFFWSYEKLDMFLDYYWVANSREEIKQLVIVFKNNGTQDLVIGEIWIDGMPVDPGDWRGHFGGVIQPEYTRTVYVAPESLMFENGMDYNLTVVTSRKSHFSFTLNVNKNNTRTEKVQIKECYFYCWPPTSYDKFIGIEVISFGDINVIVKEVWIDSASFIVSPGLWLNQFHSTDDIEISFPWKKGSTYSITIETVAGSAYQVNATAD